MVDGSVSTFGAWWRHRRPVVLVVVAALLASLLTVSPASPVVAQVDPAPEGTRNSGSFADGTELSLTITEPADGSSVSGDQVTVSGVAQVGGGEIVADTSVVLVYDVSGSAGWSAGVDCTDDGVVDSVLVCERAAMREFVYGAAEVGSVAEVAVIRFAASATRLDVRPDIAGSQPFTAPGADYNGNGIPDVIDAFSVGGTSGGTNYGSAASLACSTIAAASHPNRYVVFLSDGQPESGSAARNFLPCPDQDSVPFHTFAIGAGVTCATQGSGGRGSLQEVADLTGGTCTTVADPSVLRGLLSDLVRPEIVELSLSVNGGDPIDISDLADPQLPVQGPQAVNFSVPVDLAGPVDEVCVAAIGRRGTQLVEVTTCVEVVSNEPPIAAAGGDQSVVEGSLVTLDGSGSSDPDGDPLSYRWSLVEVSGPPILLSSMTEPSVSFLALDDGSYLLELEVSDGRSSDTDRVRVTVTNGEPAVEASVGSGVGGGGVTMVSAAFTDPGPLDVHTATIDWGDGQGPQPVAVSNQGTGWGSLYAAHIYGEQGSFPIVVTVTDDDGGEATIEMGTAEVTDPMAVWATGTDSRSISLAGSGSTIRGRAHANGGIRVAGSGHRFEGLLTFTGQRFVVGNGHVFDPPDQQTGPAEPPVLVDPADYRPGGRAATTAGADYHDMSGACGSTWKPSTVLEPGLYWAPCDVHIAGSHVFAGPITIASAGKIRVTGAGGEFFEPFVDGVLFAAGASGKDAVRVAGAGSTFVGMVHTEGEIHINGAGHRFVCGMIGDSIRVAGSGTTIEGADCAAPNRTVVAPTLVPTLGVDYQQVPDLVTPGDEIDIEVTVSNDGSTLIVPAIAGIENLGVAPIAVTGGEVRIEYLPAGETAWQPLEVPAEVDARLLPAPGVGAPSGADPFAGATVDPGATALWAVEITATVDPATLEQLLDPDQVAGLRGVTDLVVEPTGSPVRRLVRFGPDIIEDVRATGGSIADAEALVVLPDGTTHRLTSADVAGLGVLAPGASVATTFTVAVPTPTPIGGIEPTDAYLARLAALDDTLLAGGAFAFGTGGPGRLLAPLVSDSSTRNVPIVSLTVDGPDAASAGAELAWGLTLGNVGGAPAEVIALAATFAGDDLVVDGAPSSLVAGGVDEASTTARVPADADTGTRQFESSLGWASTNGTTYGPIVVDRDVEIIAGAALSASMRWFLEVDATDNGLPSPGDTLRYTAVITNRGDSAATGVAVDLPLDPNTTLVAGSATTTSGAVTEPGGDTVAVADATIPAGGTLTVEALVEIPADIDDSVVWLEAQGSITGPGLDLILTDDPARFGPDEPTRTFVIRLVPALFAGLSAQLVIDADGNGVASSGDTLRYVAAVLNGGTGAATGVEATLVADANTAVVDASSAHGEVTVDANTATATFGNVADGDTVELIVDVVIGANLPAGTELEAVLSVGASNVAGAPFNEEVLTELGAPVVPGEGGGPGSGGPTGGSAEILGLVPADGGVVTEPAEVSVGAITPDDDTAITEWFLTTFPAGTDPGAGVALAEGTGDPSGTVLGEFDPTIRTNGIWTLRLTVVDSDGAGSFAESSLVVDGQLKLGRYSVTYEDMSVPVAGIPIQVLRTYDTLNKDTEGDFGFGWNLELANFRVQTNRTLGLGPWTGESCGPGLVFVPLCFTPGSPRFVTVTWPDGRTESFDLTPTGNTFFSVTMVPKYTARPGATSTLTPAPGDTSGGRGGDGHMRTGGFGDGSIYDPQRFVLTANDGTRYLLDRTTGLVSATDRNGNTITVTPDGVSSSSGPGIIFERDAAGRIDRIIGPDGSDVSYGYDAAGDLVEVTDPNSHTTDFVYADHYLTDVIDPAGQPWRRMEYDPDTGRIAALVDANGNRTTIEVDPEARTQVVTSPDGRLTTVSTFDEHGDAELIEEIFDGQAYTTSATYQAPGLPSSMTNPAGHTTTWTWDADRNLTSVEDPTGLLTEYTHDDLGLITAIHVGGILDAAYTYDAFGSLLEESDSDGNTTSFEYDDRGRLTKHVDPAGRVETYQYDSNGFLKSLGTPTGSVTYSNDGFGRPVQMIDQAGVITVYEYDSRGDLLSITDGNGHTASWTYDYAGQVLTATDKHGLQTIHTYGAAGRLASIEQRDGTTLSYGYSATGNLTSVTGPDVGIEYEYDPLGRIVQARSPHAVVDFYFDAASRVARQVTTPVGTLRASASDVGYSYDGAGRLTEIDDGSAVTTYIYDPRGRLQSISDTDAGLFGVTYEAAARLAGLTYPNGITETRAYDPSGHVTETIASLGGTEVQRFEYGYNESGWRDRLLDATGEHLYGYDPTGQLMSVDRPAGSQLLDEAYAYDHNGNRVSWHASDAALTQLDGDRLVADASASYTFDELGRRTTRTERTTGRVTAYAWNSLGQLVEIVHPGGESTSFAYDGIGRRTEVDHDGEITRFTYAGANIRSTQDGADNLTARFTTALGWDSMLAATSGGETTYVLRDGLGTPTAVLDTAGVVLQQLVYDSFGNSAQTEDVLRPYGWTGLVEDPSGLTFARSRYYDPATGTFLSEDPIPAANAYTWVDNNPCSGTDPTGAAPMVEYAGLKHRTLYYQTFAREVGSFACAQLLNAVLTYGGGPAGIGKAGEDAVSEFLRRNKNTQLYYTSGANPRGRIPDFVTRSGRFVEVKNTAALYNTRQLRDMAAIAARESPGNPLVIITRQNTRISKRLLNAPGVKIVACLPG